MQIDLEQFEQCFWKHYPRKQGKIDAQKAWLQAIKLVSPETIRKSVMQYAFECIGKDMQYVKLPAGWLRAGRWGDILSRTVDKPEDDFCAYDTSSKAQKVFVRDGTPEMDAWDDYWLKMHGVRAPRSRRVDGWWFPSAQPPTQGTV